MFLRGAAPLASRREEIAANVLQVRHLSRPSPARRPPTPLAVPQTGVPNGALIRCYPRRFRKDLFFFGGAFCAAGGVWSRANTAQGYGHHAPIVEQSVVPLIGRCRGSLSVT